MNAKVSEASRGKWEGILAQLLGSKAKQALSRKHGPCPMCGGKDRYRFTDNRGMGDHFCNVCGAGDGMKILMAVNGWDFLTSVDEVGKIIGSIEPQPFQPQIDVEARRRSLNAMWAAADAPYLMAEYLVSRGLNWDKIKGYTRDLRGTTELLDLEHEPPDGVWRRGMVALMRNHDGAPISIHRTFFKTDLYPAVKKIMPPIETVSGAVIRLGAPEGELVIGEGIETALAGCQAFEMPGVATISANNMVEFAPPSSVKRVVILADNDRSFTGQSVAFQLARKLRTQRKLKVEVVMPETPGDDFCDFALRGGTLAMWDGGDPNDT